MLEGSSEHSVQMTSVIFDIDGTLVDSVAFDASLYIAAIRDVLGNVSIRSDLHSYPQQTDTGILMDICEENGLSEDSLSSVRTRFGNLVSEYLNGGGKCLQVPGAISLLDRLARIDSIHVGIATGGWGHTAEMKLSHAGFNLNEIFIASADHGYRRTEIMEFCRSRLPAVGTTTYIGDAEWDQQASERLGWNFIGVGSRLRSKCMNWVPDLTSVKVSDF